jgi:hypothetical protein
MMGTADGVRAIRRNCGFSGSHGVGRGVGNGLCAADRAGFSEPDESWQASRLPGDPMQDLPWEAQILLRRRLAPAR